MRTLAAGIIFFLGSHLNAWAADVKFSAEADRSEVSQDESVSVKLSIEQGGSPGRVSDPEIEAPDFDQLQSYQSQSVQSFYENGKFGMRTTQDVTVVLRPKKTGALLVKGIKVQVEGQAYSAPDILITVTPGGAGTSPPKGYGGGVGLRGAGKRAERRPFLVRAEISKEKLYRGEQLIVSYYLYRRVRIFNMQASQYPVLSGFLREDIDLPIVTGNLKAEPVVLDGNAYDRVLLARYAAYPLQEGELKIDSMTIQANYYGQSQPGLTDDEDPFFQFFKRLAPQSDTEKSDALSVEVLPLPTAGKPQDFSGIVGEFEVKAAIDKTEVKTGEPLTLTVMIEGRGSLSSLKEPKPAWPDGIEPYESKGKSKPGGGGIGQKVFEFLLIPRKTGELVLPSVELNFFDPSKKTYEIKRTDPIRVQVLPGAPGSESSQVPQGAASHPNPQAPQRLDDLVPPGAFASNNGGRTWLDRVARGIWAAVIALSLLSLFGFLRRKKSSRSSRVDLKKERDERWQRLEKQATLAKQGLPSVSIESIYAELETLLLAALESAYGIPARARSRLEIRDDLQRDPRWDASLWERCDRVLAFSEQVRFSRADLVFQALSVQSLDRNLAEVRQILEKLQSIG